MSTFLGVFTIIGSLLFTIGDAIDYERGGLLRTLGVGCIACVVIFLIGYTVGGIN